MGMYVHVMFSISDGHVCILSVLHDLHAGWVTGVCRHRYILFSVCCLYPLLLQTTTHSWLHCGRNWTSNKCTLRCIVMNCQLWTHPNTDTLEVHEPIVIHFILHSPCQLCNSTLTYQCVHAKDSQPHTPSHMHWWMEWSKKDLLCTV